MYSNNNSNVFNTFYKLIPNKCLYNVIPTCQVCMVANCHCSQALTISTSS